MRSNVQDLVHFAPAGAGISASNLRYVEVSSKKGRRKAKETAYINYMDGHNGVVLTTEKQVPDRTSSKSALPFAQRTPMTLRTGHLSGISKARMDKNTAQLSMMWKVGAVMMELTRDKTRHLNTI